MDTNSKNAGNNEGQDDNSYSKEEKVLLEKIAEDNQVVNKCTQTIADKNLNMGKSCDLLIKLHNGTVYGGKTFQRVLQYLQQKGINCSLQHLRHCWHFYRLMTDKAYENDNLKLLSKRSSAVFPLCRIFDTDLEEKEKIELLNEVEAIAVKKNLSVVDIILLVNSKLEEKGLKKKKSKLENPAEPPQKDSVVVCENQFRQYDFLIKAVVKSEDMVKKVMNSQIKCNEIVCRFENHVSLLEKIPDCYKGKEFKSQIKIIADRLNKMLK